MLDTGCEPEGQHCLTRCLQPPARNDALWDLYMLSVEPAPGRGELAVTSVTKYINFGTYFRKFYHRC